MKRTFAAAANQLPTPGNGRRFEEVKQQMLASLQGMVYIKSDKQLDYLRPLFGRINPLVIATLNYDNAIENAAEQNGWKWTDGLDEWNGNRALLPSVFDQKTAYLLKLHGSVYWQHDKVQDDDEYNHHRSRVGNMPRSAFTSTNFVRADLKMLNNGAHTNPGVIFGGSNKLTHEGPFLEVLRSFQQYLDNVNILTVIGYSFRDQHINAPIGRWLEKDSSHILRIVDPCFSKCDAPFAKQIMSFMKDNSGRVSVMELQPTLSASEYNKLVCNFTGDCLRELYGGN